MLFRMQWTGQLLLLYNIVAWTDGLITNCRAIIISGVGAILTILRHVYIHVYIYIWEVVALGGTQTNYNIGGVS